MTDEPAAEAAGGIECPVCGGRSQLGEVICNFCGTRLAAPGTESPAEGINAPARTRVSPEGFVPASERASSGQFAAPPDALPPEEESGGRSILGLLGFALAAIIAIAGGTWLAIYLSNRHRPAPMAQTSPSPAAINAPAVVLAKTIPVQTSAGVTPPRDAATLAQVFESNKAGLDDIYRNALASNAGLEDGMMLRLRVNPDGSVSDASVRVSTAPNPSLDADVVRAASGWKFAPSGGAAIDADYPLIFASAAGNVPGIEASLNTKLASLGPNEAPEYALSPSAPTPELAASPIPTAMASAVAALPPESVATPPTAAPAPSRHKRHETAAYRPPPMPLRERVNNALASNRKLRRVQIYTSGGNVTMYGKVFDDKDRMLAEQTVRGVSGVTSVTNNLMTDQQDWAHNASLINQQLQNAGITGVTVNVVGKTAYLNGEVQSDADKDRAVAIAQSAAPVRVVNFLRVAPGRVF
jgi:TonB family protein